MNNCYCCGGDLENSSFVFYEPQREGRKLCKFCANAVATVLDLLRETNVKAFSRIKLRLESSVFGG